MTKAFRLVGSFCLVFGVLSLSAMDHPFKWSKDFSKTIIKEFDASQGQEIIAQNRYGQVNVDTWDRSEVKYTVEIIVDARNEKAAEEVYDRIEILFQESGERISAETKIESGSSWSWWGSSSGTEFSINYTIMMPAKNPIRVANKYGDCNIRGVTGNAHFTIKYGNLNVYDPLENMQLELGYGKAKVQDVVDAGVAIKYSKFKGGCFEKLKIESKYSNIITEDIGTLISRSKYDDYQIGRVSTLDNIGKYDDFEIQEVSDLKLTTSYSDFEIGKLYHFAECDMRYGELTIDQVDGRFRKINITGQYTDFVLGTYDLDVFDFAFDMEYVDFHLSTNIETTNNAEDGNSRSVAGYRKNKDKGGKIQGELRYGNLVLK